MTKRTAQRIQEHQDAGHSVMVRCGIVRCDDCEETIDASQHRPGLVGANQSR